MRVGDEGRIQISIERVGKVMELLLRKTKRCTSDGFSIW